MDFQAPHREITTATDLLPRHHRRCRHDRAGAHLPRLGTWAELVRRLGGAHRWVARDGWQPRASTAPPQEECASWTATPRGPPGARPLAGRGRPLLTGALRRAERTSDGCGCRAQRLTPTRVPRSPDGSRPGGAPGRLRLLPARRFTVGQRSPSTLWRSGWSWGNCRRCSRSTLRARTAGAPAAPWHCTPPDTPPGSAREWVSTSPARPSLAAWPRGRGGGGAWAAHRAIAACVPAPADAEADIEVLGDADTAGLLVDRSASAEPPRRAGGAAGVARSASAGYRTAHEAGFRRCGSGLGGVG